MADLSSIDPTTPTAGSNAGLGDDQIRDLKDMIKNSFHGANMGTGAAFAEHYGKGFHKFASGNTASRPTVGNVGRIYINTETKTIEFDNGTNWQVLNTVGIYSSSALQGVSSNPTYTTITSQVITVPTGARVIVLAFIANGSANVAGLRIYEDAVSISLVDAAIQGISGGLAGQTVMFGVNLAPTAGSKTYALKGYSPTGANVTLTGGIIVLVL